MPPIHKLALTRMAVLIMMKNFHFSKDKTKVQAQEVIELFVAVGWGTVSSYTPAMVARSLEAYPLIVTARNVENKLIAYASVFSDSMFTTMMGELVVHPNYRKCGIGRRILEIIEQEYPDVGFYIKTFEENTPFFEHCGFTRSSKMVVLSKVTTPS